MNPENRRAFLKKSMLTVVGGAAVSVWPAPARAAAANDKVVMATIGVGGRGCAVTRPFLQDRGVEVAYLCEVDGSRNNNMTREVSKRQRKDTQRISDFRRALDDNRRLWHALEEDLASPGNQLPDQLKAQIISVAIWVERHSKLAEQGDAEIDALIQVNESIMKGLAA